MAGWRPFIVKVLTGLAIVLTGQVSAAGRLTADSGQMHTDTEAGIRFSVPFPIYQKKSALQVENLIKDALTGDLPQHLVYSSAVYADDSDAFVVVWRQKIAELPSRYQFRRLKFLAPLRTTAKISNVRIIEEKAAATFSLDPQGPFKAQVAMILTQEENVFVGLYSRIPDAEKFASLVTSLEVDPKRAVQWSALDTGLKPVWFGLILAVGFFLGFLGYLLVVNMRSQHRKKIKKPGEFSSPDRYKQESERIPDGI